MSSATAPLRPMRWTTDSKKSVFYTLHAPLGQASFEDAVGRDMILRGITVAELITLPALASGVVDPSGGAGASVDLSHTERGAPSLHERPFFMATGSPLSGGAGINSPLSITRASTPLLAHSASSSSNRRITTGVAPTSMARQPQRQMTLRTINFDSPKFVPAAGYSLQLEVSVPTNWSNHGNVREKTAWEGAGWTFVVSEDGTRLKYALMVDTAGGSDSWMYCNLIYQGLIKNPVQDSMGSEVMPWNRYLEPLYNEKPKIPIPPEQHLNDDRNIAWITYGTQDLKGDVVIAQTLVKMKVNTTARHHVEVPSAVPMGIAIGTTPRELCLTHHGILGHGRRNRGKLTFFGRSVLWDSKSLVEVMKESGMINEEIFTIYINHPTLAPSAPNCIIYGTPYNPTDPHIPFGPDANWKELPVVSPTAREAGYWTLHLVHIVLHAKSEDAAGRVATKQFRADINAPVRVDSAAACTFLPESAGTRLNDAFEAIRLRSDDRHFHPRDDVELIFSRGIGDSERISIIGQAQRFFESVHLGQNGQTECACVGTAGNTYLLGLNFFRTFILSFEDHPVGAQICARAHDYV